MNVRSTAIGCSSLLCSFSSSRSKLETLVRATGIAVGQQHSPEDPLLIIDSLTFCPSFGCLKIVFCRLLDSER